MAMYYSVNATTEVADIDSENASAAATVTATAPSEAQQALATFWPRVTEDIRKTGLLDLKTQALPLARIKKIMKLDEDVKMISAEAPMLFAKAAEIFIHELTLRAWVHTEDNKRRTLQRNDIAMAISKFDQFDFLIDIVPREELKPAKAPPDTARGSMSSDQIHYYFQLAQQHQQALQQSNTNSSSSNQQAATPTIQIVQPSSTQIVQMASVNNANSQGSSTTSQIVAAPRQGTVRVTQGAAGAAGAAQAQAQHVIQIQQAASAAQPAQAQAQQAASAGIQIVQQIVTPSGEVQQVPIQLSAEQMQMIRMQLQGNTSQPAIIQIQPQIIQQ